MKTVLKSLMNRAGLNVVSLGRLGVEVELDLARLSAEMPIRSIFDVGANVGQSAVRFARAFPGAQIYSFEPVPDTFARLKDAVKTVPSVRCFNKALGETTGTAQINLAASSGSNSLRPIESSSGCIEVQVSTLEEVCESNSVTNIDLLKIDVEGFEIQVLRGAAQLLNAAKIRFVYAECAMPPTGNLVHTSFLDLHSFLSERGFCFVCWYPEAFYLTQGCAMGNVLYALRSALPSRVPGSVLNIA